MHPHGTTTRTCEHCQKAFAPHPKTKGRFCSRACWRAYESAHQHTRICVACGVTFRAKIAKPQRFCSRACADPNRTMTPIEDRFWAKVDRTGECWVWTGYRDPNGYGRISRGNGIPPILASRLSWLLHHGTLPDDLYVCHHCDNPSCVRPDHLFLGDQKANMQDAARKNRTTLGERSAASKLSDAAVRDMRLRYAAGQASIAELAAEHGVLRGTIKNAIEGVTWRHVA